jgi:hypothetical protein
MLSAQTPAARPYLVLAPGRCRKVGDVGVAVGLSPFRILPAALAAALQREPALPAVLAVRFAAAVHSPATQSRWTTPPPRARMEAALKLARSVAEVVRAGQARGPETYALTLADPAGAAPPKGLAQPAPPASDAATAVPAR